MVFGLARQPHEQGDLQMNDVVVGVDTSDTARRAAVAAAELASAYSVNLHIVTCAQASSALNVGIGSESMHSDWVSEAASFLKELARGLPHDQITTAVKSGDPAGTICDEAKRLDARAIVVGNRRVQGVSRVLGSVASQVLKKATCDVLISYTK